MLCRISQGDDFNTRFTRLKSIMEKTKAGVKVGWFIIGFIVAAIVAFILWSTFQEAKPKIACIFSPYGEEITGAGVFAGTCDCRGIKDDVTSTIVSVEADELICNAISGAIDQLGAEEPSREEIQTMFPEISFPETS